MESRDEKETICTVEQTAPPAPDAKCTGDKKHWLSQDNDTLPSAAVKLMLSIVVSTKIAIIAFILQNGRYNRYDIMCDFYVAVILLWVALMHLVFSRFMWNRVLKNKPKSTKFCFAFGMALNLLVLFSATIYALTTFHDDFVLYIMLFIGVFNSMVILMFHDTKTLKEDENKQKLITHEKFEELKDMQALDMNAHEITQESKDVQVSVEEEQGK